MFRTRGILRYADFILSLICKWESTIKTRLVSYFYYHRKEDVITNWIIHNYFKLLLVEIIKNMFLTEGTLWPSTTCTMLLGERTCTTRQIYLFWYYLGQVNDHSLLLVPCYLERTKTPQNNANNVLCYYNKDKLEDFLYSL